MAKIFEIRNSIAEFLTFVAEGNEEGIQVLYKDETVWATQKAMAMLFDCSTDNVGLHLGERIRELCEQKNIDVMTLAFKANIQPNTLKRIEAGKFSVDLDILAQIAQGMGMKIDFVELNNEENHESISDIRN